jgi:hypothetical protein
MKDRISNKCSTQGRTEKYLQILVWKTVGKRSLENLGVCGSEILNLKKLGCDKAEWIQPTHDWFQ